MILRTPFHHRTSAANQTGLWSHWSGYLVADRYQMSGKFEYFAIRNAACVFDTSPLYKYRIAGREAERYLSGVLTRDVRTCPPGRAQYTVWCDDQGWVLEDGMVLRLAEDEFLLTTAKPNLAFFQGLTGPLAVGIEDVSSEFGALAVQGPCAREVLASVAPEMADLGFLHLAQAKIGGSPVTISRTGYTGDLGYEVWMKSEDAIEVWDRIFEASSPAGAIPVGLTALLIARIEAGLLLIDVDFHSARFAWNDDQRSTPLELGLGWMLRGLERDGRAFIGRSAIEREMREGTSRWNTKGIMVNWQDWTRTYNRRGLVPPKDHTPYHGGMMIYDDRMERIGYAASFVYSPILQRHIGIARLRPEHSSAGTPVGLEVNIDHNHEVVGSQVTRLPLFNPPRRTA